LTQGPDPTIFDLSAQFHKHCNGSYPNPAFVFFVLFVVEQGLFLTTKDSRARRWIAQKYVTEFLTTRTEILKERNEAPRFLRRTSHA
jgi:hypothetical protein